MEYWLTRTHLRTQLRRMAPEGRPKERSQLGTRRRSQKDCTAEVAVQTEGGASRTVILPKFAGLEGAAPRSGSKAERWKELDARMIFPS